MDTERIRSVIARHGRLAVDARALTDDDDLYQVGLTSLATVNLMLGLEAEFGVEFPDALLGQATFRSVGSMDQALRKLAPAA